MRALLKNSKPLVNISIAMNTIKSFLLLEAGHAKSKYTGSIRSPMVIKLVIDLAK